MFLILKWFEEVVTEAA